MKLQCPEASYTDFTVVIILDIGSTLVGAGETRWPMWSRAPPTSSSPPQFERQGHVDPAFVTGIASLGERMLIVMDIEALLSSDEIGLVRSAAHR